MTDRELLETILSKIDSMETRIGMESRMGNIESELGNVKIELGDIKTGLGDVKTELEDVKTDLAEVKSDVEFTKNTVIKIENDHGQILNALLDVCKQDSEKLDRIEKEVCEHYEIIIRR